MVASTWRALDSNVLVYASLADHPAMSACENLIGAHPEWLVNIVNLIEMHRVLVSVYGVSPSDADMKFEDYQMTLEVVELSGAIASKALPLRQTHKIDFNDAVLIATCLEEGVKLLATDDGRLSDACAELGIAVANPIDPSLRGQMASWEEEHLPPKGLPRVLGQVHRWLCRRDAVLAEEFYSETQALSRLV